MTPRTMGEFIVRAADAFGLEQPHLVGPDVGTSAALFAAAAHDARFLSLVVGTGGAAIPIQLGDPLREWVFAPDLEPYRRLGGRPIVQRAMGTLERYTPTDAAREDYLASYDGDRFAESMPYVQSYPVELKALRDRLPHIRPPVQIIAGGRDIVVPLVNAEYLHERLPHSELRVIDAGHFVWEDAGDEYANVVTDWWGFGSRPASTDRRGLPAVRERGVWVATSRRDAERISAAGWRQRGDGSRRGRDDDAEMKDWRRHVELTEGEGTDRLQR